MLPSNCFKKLIQRQAPRFCVSFGVARSWLPGRTPRPAHFGGTCLQAALCSLQSISQETQDVSVLMWQPRVLLESRLFPCFCFTLHPGLWFPASWLLPGAEWLLDLQSSHLHSGKQGRWRGKDESLISQPSHFFLSAFSQILSSTSVFTSLVRTWTHGHTRCCTGDWKVKSVNCLH